MLEQPLAFPVAQAFIFLDSFLFPQHSQQGWPRLPTTCCAAFVWLLRGAMPPHWPPGASHRMLALGDGAFPLEWLIYFPPGGIAWQVLFMYQGLLRIAVLTTSRWFWARFLIMHLGIAGCILGYYSKKFQGFPEF